MVWNFFYFRPSKVKWEARQTRSRRIVSRDAFAKFFRKKKYYLCPKFEKKNLK
jgi:hypothetical protein